jgi:DEAD/DEAH box helicase domain-containing protein
LLQLIPEPARPRLALLTGDTPPKTREQLLAANPSIISATPELIHYALKGVHWSQPWQHFLSRLRYIVLDEAHTFNGVYGANMASLIRRLKLAVDERGGCSQKLQFLMLSATVGNPVQLGKLLSGRSRKRNINGSSVVNMLNE